MRWKCVLQYEWCVSAFWVFWAHFNVFFSSHQSLFPQSHTHLVTHLFLDIKFHTTSKVWINYGLIEGLEHVSYEKSLKQRSKSTWTESVKLMSFAGFLFPFWIAFCITNQGRSQDFLKGEGEGVAIFGFWKNHCNITFVLNFYPMGEIQELCPLKFPNKLVKIA